MSSRLIWDGGIRTQLIKFSLTWYGLCSQQWRREHVCDNGNSAGGTRSSFAGHSRSGRHPGRVPAAAQKEPATATTTPTGSVDRWIPPSRRSPTGPDQVTTQPGDRWSWHRRHRSYRWLPARGYGRFDLNRLSAIVCRRWLHGKTQ